jgi:hypothetical protein
MMRFGTTPCSTSVAETATNVALKDAAMAASAETPNFQTQPATRRAVASSTSG